jgi:hypothetical protein
VRHFGRVKVKDRYGDSAVGGEGDGVLYLPHRSIFARLQHFDFSCLQVKDAGCRKRGERDCFDVHLFFLETGFEY